MKQRFSSLDVKAIAHELSATLCTLRLANVYDLSSRIFLFKFAKPGERQQVLVDSGFRCHLTAFARATANTPSAFVARLRKFLRTRRVTAVSQIGTDRIVELQFSDGQYRLFLEFYAAGNIVLTDNELNVLALLRAVTDEQEQLRVGLKYQLTTRQDYGGPLPLTLERVRDVLRTAEGTEVPGLLPEQAKWRRKKKDKRSATKKALAVGFKEFPGLLIDHVLKVANIDQNTSVDDILRNADLLEQVFSALQAAQSMVQDMTSSKIIKGYIIAKPTQSFNKQDVNSALPPGSDQKLVYEDFQPFRPSTVEDNGAVQILEIEGFNQAVDQFYSSIESQKLESKLTEREELAKKKLEKARLEHDKRLGILQEAQEMNVRKAQAIEANLARVEEAMAAVNDLINSGMDWYHIDKLIESEQKRQNPVAEIIQLPLKLSENVVTLLLGEPSSGLDDQADLTESEYESSNDEDDNDKITATDKGDANQSDLRLKVDIDLTKSPWANAREYYDEKRLAAAKEEKTLLSSEKALKAQERKITADLQRDLKQEKQVLRPVRNQLWFEKFMYFISSEGYLVLAGKDVQQNELLYRRHLKTGDVYVHADLNGAASIVIKNRPGSPPDAPIPPSTLSQAGTLAVTSSSAWDSKAIMSAWWVSANQVSKTAPNGDLLEPGIFRIEGTKNYLPPAQLILGFAVMFQISVESKARHLKHRIQEELDITENEPGPPESRQATAVDQKDVVEQTELATQQLKIQDSSDSEDSQDGDEQQEDLDSLPPNPLKGNRSVSSNHESDNLEEVEESTLENPEQQDVTLAEPSHEGDTVSNRGGADEISSTPSTGIRHLSAHQRRLLRKGIDPGSVAPATPSSSGLSTPQSSAQPDSQIHVPRGKRAKNKKIAQKYKDQTDEDRLLAAQLLGSIPSASHKARNSASKAVEKAAVEKAAAEAKERRREQHLRQSAKLKEYEQKRLHGANDAIEDEEDDEQVDFETLVGTPLPGDEILAAIPVSAPWSALNTYAYRVKLQPGTMKKGKAIREILGGWSRDLDKEVKGENEEEAAMRKRAKELVSGWKDVEAVGTLPVSKVRIVGGLTRGENKGKNKNKSRGQGQGKGTGTGKSSKGKQKGR